MRLNNIQAAHYPFAAGNPYQTLMRQALQGVGVSTVALPGSLAGLAKFLLGRSSHGVLHLHWVCGLITGRSLLVALVKLCLFQLALRVWHLRGRKIVWTVHNLSNHEQMRLWLDHLHSRLTARVADVLLVHGEAARVLVMQSFNIPAHKIRVVPHGNYSPLLPEPTPPIPHEGVRFLFFGAVRRYKAIGALLEAFGGLSGPHSLHIAGAASDASFARELTEMASKDSRVRFTPGFLSDDKLATELASCDVVVMPYLDILTSGSLLMALSAGRASVAPRLGGITDYTRDDISFLYDPADPQGLSRALQEASASRDLPERGQRAYAQAKCFDWGNIGQDLAC